MKKIAIVLLFVLSVNFVQAQTQQKDTALSVTALLSVWNSIISEMVYAKDRANESNLTEVQKQHIDSSITQINRFIIAQLNKQLQPTTTPKK